MLGLALVWLARRTRRYVNLPLAAAALVVLVTLVVGTVGLLAVKEGVDTTRDGVYAATLSTAQARIAGFDAKSNESLTLIARGSGAAFEKAWQASNAAVNAELTELAQNPASSGLSPLPWSRVRLGPPADPRARRLRGLGWSRRARDGHGAGSGNATFAAFDTQLRRAAGRPERPDLAAARRRRRLVAAVRCARAAGRAGRGRLCLVGRLAATGGVPVSRRPGRALAILTVLVAGLGAGACTAGVYDPTPLYTALADAVTVARVAVAQRVTITVAVAVGHGHRVHELPAVVRPARHHAVRRARCRPAATCAPIQDRGHLIAGVSADSLLLGARNPITGQIEGFDIDMLHAVSQALFGDPTRSSLKVITSGQRLTALQDGSVDIVARNMTITCERWKNIAFSSEYYRSGQKVLVRKGEAAQSGGPIGGIEDLAGKKVCAPDPSTSLTKLRTFKDVEAVGRRHAHRLPGAVPAGRGRRHHRRRHGARGAGRPGPLRGGRPGTRVHRRALRPRRQPGERRLRALRQRRPRADMRADGRWTKSYNTWLADSLGKAPAPPEPVYGRAP